MSLGAHSPPPRRRAWRAVAGLLVGAFAVASCGGSPSTRTTGVTDSLSGFSGAALPAGGPVHDFTLTDQYGRRVSLSSYRGHVVVLTFLYPTCGAPCVLIAEQIRGALAELGRGVPVLIVSADPAADSPRAIRGFLEEVSLAGRALYLTGTPAQLRPLWSEYHVKPASAGATAFRSYAEVLVLDRRGVARVLFEQEELSPEGLAHDIAKLESP